MKFQKVHALVLGILIAAGAYAANVTISGLPAASALSGTEPFETVQSGSKKATAAQIATYVRSVTTKSDVGLGNVDNTSDANKPVSTATQSALDLKQPLDAELTAIAGLTSAADKLPYFTGSGTAAVADLSSFGRSLIDDAASSNARTTLGVAIGSNVQAWDADLDAIAALTPTNDDVLQRKAGAWTNRTMAQLRTDLGLVIGTNVQAWDADLDTWATKTAPAGTVVGTSDSQTLSNKTLTSPAITTPTGIVKGDVGLGNVDNTSDATKNAAVATLTNKSIGGGQITSAVATATALAANGTNCSAGNYPLGVDASGNAESCTSAATGTGDASTNTSSSVDSEIGLFSGTGGKTFKRSTGTGLSLLTSGVLSALAVTDDSLPLANGTTYQVKTLPDCTDVTGNHLNYTASTNSFSCGTSGSAGTPAGSTTQVQYNNAGAFGADAGFTYASASDTLTLGETGTNGVLTGAADVGSSSGAVTVRTETGAAGDGSGVLTVSTGTGGSSSGTGGDLNVTAGAGGATNGAGGNLNLSAGGSPGSGTGGTVTVTAGDSTSGTDGVFNLNVGGSTRYSASAAGTHTYTAAEPRLILNESDQTTDEKITDIDLNAKTFLVRSRTDADGAGTNLISGLRGTGTAWASLNFGNATNNPSYGFLGSGTATFSGAVLSNGSAGFVSSAAMPVFEWRETDQGTDLKNWQENVATQVWQLRTITDAGGTGKNVLAFTRGATTAIASMVYGNATDLPTHTFNGSVIFANAGDGLKVKEGSNATMGTCTLVGGACTVSTTKVTANSRVFVTEQALGTVAVPSALAVTARTAGTSFTITASAATDTSAVAWMLIEPAP